MEVKLDNGMKWLVLFEVIFIAILLIIRFIYDKHQKNKDNENVDKVLKYINTRAQEDKDIKRKFKECIDNIKQSNKE